MKKWMKIILILFGLGVILAFIVYKFVYNKPHTNYEKVAAEYTITANSIFNDYRERRAFSDENYTGKVIEIEGKIFKIEDLDSTVIAVFVFEEGMFGDEGVRCIMLSNYHDTARSLGQGNYVRLKGYCTGYNETDVIFEKCSIIK